MFGPESKVTIVLLLMVAAGLLVALVRTRHLALRLVAGVLSLTTAMLLGVILVNDYYSYYNSWGALWDDVTGGGPAHVRSVASVGEESKGQLQTMLRRAGVSHQVRKNGLLLTMPFPGVQSGITRNGMVFLPPQYFAPGHGRQRLPVVELLHGDPGNPANWVSNLHAPTIYRALLTRHQAAPAVLVIPDTNGGKTNSLQCLNEADGPQDETYLVDDVPRFVASRLRVEPPGRRWGLLGFSEGGYCAANLALRTPSAYGPVGIMSGYFEPLDNRNGTGHYDPFRGNGRLRAENSPLAELQGRTLTAGPPPFWLAVGGADHEDMTEAHAFIKALAPYQPHPPIMIVGGGRHNYDVWRAGFAGYLKWASAFLTGRSVGAAPNRR
jgi:S-formylglutathione hydrolase FrmB